MPSEKKMETLFKNLRRLARAHEASVELKLDGSPVAEVLLEPRSGGVTAAIIRIKNFRKALTSPALLKAALSLASLRHAGKEGGLSIEFESGTIKKLFGSKEHI